MSNTLSEIVESVANAVENPYEVISSEDMLNRVQNCKMKLKEYIEKKKEQAGAELGQAQPGLDKNWKWTDDLIMLGSDVKSLFPSLTAKETGRAVRRQFEKSKIKWTNIDWKLITLYIKLHENQWKNETIRDIKKYLPNRVTKFGRPPSLATENIETRVGCFYVSAILS